MCQLTIDEQLPFRATLIAATVQHTRACCRVAAAAAAAAAGAAAAAASSCSLILRRPRAASLHSLYANFNYLHKSDAQDLPNNSNNNDKDDNDALLSSSTSLWQCPCPRAPLPCPLAPCPASCPIDDQQAKRQTFNSIFCGSAVVYRANRKSHNIIYCINASHAPHNIAPTRCQDVDSDASISSEAAAGQQQRLLTFQFLISLISQ